MHATLINQTTGAIKQVKVGYSWTMLFFGFWVPIFRGDYKIAIMSLLADMFSGTLFSTIYGFLYNKQYVENLLEHNYLPADENSKNILLTKQYVTNVTPISKSF